NHRQGARGATSRSDGRAVERAAYLDCAFRKIKRRREGKAVPALADAGACKVFAIAVCQNLADQSIVRENIETDRRVGMIGAISPAFDRPRRYDIDTAL